MSRKELGLVIIVLIIIALAACKKSSSRFQSHHDHQAYQAIHHIPEPVHLSPGQIHAVKDLDEGQRSFIANFLPLIHAANLGILAQRQLLSAISKDFENKGMLDAENFTALNVLLLHYRLSVIDTSHSSDKGYIAGCLDSLYLRVDVVPERLVLAQAIVESGWGSSRFCSLANNYFGVHCYSKGCGVKPKDSPETGFEVKKYHSKLDAIRDYLRIINTGFAYEKLREQRAKSRSQGKKADPYELAGYLGRYSTEGSNYIVLLKDIMQDYIPEDLDGLLEK